MGLIKSYKRSPPIRKHPTFGSGDELSYAQGSSKPSAIQNISTYQNSVERLDTAIRTIADVASKAKLEFFKEDSKGKLTKTKVKNVDTLFLNDYQDFVAFNKTMMATLLRSSSLLIVPEKSKDPDRTGLIDFYALDNNKWYLEATKGNTTISHFVYRTSDGNELKYPYKDVMYIVNSYDVTNPLYGVPKITSLNRIIQMELSSTAFAQNYTAQGGKKSIVAGYTEWLSEDNREKIKTEISNYLSSPEARLLLLNAENLKLQTTSDGLNTAQIIELMTMINNSIMESFRLPPALLGKDHNGLNTEILKISARVFYEITISPLLTSVEAHFTRYFRNVLGLKNLVVKFNTENIKIFEDSVRDTVELTVEKLKYGIITPNESRVLTGHEPLDVDAMDEVYPPAFVIGSGGVSYQELESVGSSDIPDEVPSGDGGANNTPELGGAG